jgi:hypothetical protein
MKSILEIVSMVGIIVVIPLKLKCSHDYFYLDSKLFLKNGLLKGIYERLKCALVGG